MEVFVLHPEHLPGTLLAAVLAQSLACENNFLCHLVACIGIGRNRRVLDIGLNHYYVLLNRMECVARKELLILRAVKCNFYNSAIIYWHRIKTNNY